MTFRKANFNRNSSSVPDFLINEFLVKKEFIINKNLSRYLISIQSKNYAMEV